MLKDELLSALICPKCAGSLKQDNPEHVVCCQCSQVYAVENGIPILLRNPEESLSDIKQRIKSNPTWYESEQLKRIDEGPYRHHLRKRVKYLSEVLHKHMFTAPRILDAGCGDGANLRYLIEVPNSTVFGLDNNPLRLMRAQEYVKDQAFLVLGDILERNLREDYFDIILCNHVLEHIERDYDVLINLYTTLKSGGLLILGTPNEGAWLWQLNYKVIQPDIMKSTDHFHFYTAKKLKGLLMEKGFSVKEIKFMGWGLPHTMVDALLRKHKWIDDLFGIIGRLICKSQATSLYFVCKKEKKIEQS